MSVTTREGQTISFINNQSIISDGLAFDFSRAVDSLSITNIGTINSNDGSETLRAHIADIINNGNWTDLSEDDFLFDNSVIKVTARQDGHESARVNIQNTGTIQGAQLGIYVLTENDSKAEVTINNSGTISGNSGDGFMAPIYLSANGTAGATITATINNEGSIINEAEDSDIQLMLYGNTNSDVASSVTIGTYHLTPKKGYIWNVQYEGILKFNEQTKLVLTPKSEDGFVEGETVAVSDILSLTDAWGSEDSLGKVEGKLTAGQVISIDPLYEVIFEDADNTMDQRFGLSNPNAGLSGGAQFGKYQLRAARERADRLAEILTPVKLTQDHNVWVRPYASQSRFRDENPTDIDTEGIVLGTSHRISNSIELGAHFGYENNSWDASDILLDGDSDTIYAGVHGIYQPNDFWGIRGFVTGIWGDNEVKSRLLNDASKDDVDSLSVMADVTTYFNFPVTEHSTLRPELGVAYIHTKTDAWDTQWSREDNQYLNRSFKKQTYDDVFMRAKLRWFGEFETDQGATVKPNVSIGARVMLTDNSFDSSMLLNGQYYSTDIKDDRALGLVGIGFTVGKDHWRFSLEGQGAYGANTTSHMIWGTATYDF